MAYSRDVFSFLQRHTYCSDYVGAKYTKESDRFSSMEVNDVESQVLSKVYTELQQLYVVFDYPSHGWDHIELVYCLALFVA